MSHKQERRNHDIHGPLHGKLETDTSTVGENGT